jgi:hypothetical protein
MALGIVRAYVQGNTELICIGGQKNILTQSILAKLLDAQAKTIKPEDFCDRRFLRR